MKANKDKGLVLIENPGTGNEAVGRALGLSKVARPSAFPLEARMAVQDTPELVGGRPWTDCTKIILVRDIRARFESMATKLVSLGKQDHYTPEFNSLMDDMPACSPKERATRILEFMRDDNVVPAELLPQSRWLRCKFDLILSTQDIAEYFNRVVGKSCLRINGYRSNPLMRAHYVSVESETLLREVYAADYDLFHRLRVWSPVPGEIRLVNGPCRRCNDENNKGAFDFIGGDELSDEDATNDAEAEEVSKDSLHGRAKKKVRKRKQTWDKAFEQATGAPAPEESD